MQSYLSQFGSSVCDNIDNIAFLVYPTGLSSGPSVATISEFDISFVTFFVNSFVICPFVVATLGPEERPVGRPERHYYQSDSQPSAYFEIHFKEGKKERGK